MVLSGARLGTLCGSGWPSEGPPKPPSPRAKREATSVASSSPFSFLSTVLCRITAPLSLPLSKTSRTLESAAICAAPARGPWKEMSPSPPPPTTRLRVSFPCPAPHPPPSGLLPPPSSPRGEGKDSDRRKERQRRAIGRFEHHFDLLADPQSVHVAVDEIGQQRRTFLQCDVTDRVRPCRGFAHQAESV